MLRDLIRNISNGNKLFKGLNVAVADERGEIAATYKGIPQNDVGIRTDVLDNIPKNIGMRILIRSMSPQVIAADEIGSNQDIISIQEAMSSGVKGLFTAHGSSLENLYINTTFKNLLNLHIFERIIFLNPKGERGKLENIYYLDKKKLVYCRK